MDRRNFLRSMLGVAAATALPSEAWPFKKIFVPTLIPVSRIDVLDLKHWGEIEAIELEVFAEVFAKEIHDLIFRNTPFYNLLKKRGTVDVGTDLLRLPMVPAAPDMGSYLGLSRSVYPGRLGRNLLHAPATPENIVRLANELEDISKCKS